MAAFHWVNNLPKINNHAAVEKLVPKLKFRIRYTYRKMPSFDGPLGRISSLKKTVTALFMNERIELNYNRASEARPYADRLIVEAIRNQANHRPTMELADFWLEEKQAIHKLFEVFVPRYINYKTSFTRMYNAPQIFPGTERQRAILELRGNPFPPVIPEEIPQQKQLHNILLDAARLDKRM